MPDDEREEEAARVLVALGYGVRRVEGGMYVLSRDGQDVLILRDLDLLVEYAALQQRKVTPST